MTTSELKTYYSDLLIMQYKNKEKAKTTVEHLVSMSILDQLPASVRDGFSIEDAVGEQLDVIGKVVGVRRTNDLSDADFKILIRLKVVINNSESTTYEIQEFLNEYFDEQVYFFDHQTMRVGYFIDTNLWSEELSLSALQQDVLPYPMSVERSSTIFADTETLKIFYGFRTYGSESYNSSPMNDYGSYEESFPWLGNSYSEIPEILKTEGGDTLTTEDGEVIVL